MSDFVPSGYYAFIEDGKITKIDLRPKWFDDTGKLLSDDDLKAHNIFPIDKQTLKPAYNFLIETVVENPVDDWLIDFDQGRVYVTYTKKTLDLSVIKENLKREVHHRFVNELKYGRLRSSLGFTVDCRRDFIYNDLQNLEIAIQQAETDDNFSIYWKDVEDNLHQLTIDQAKQLRDEMLKKMLWLYTYKWQKLEEIDSLESVDQASSFEIWNEEEFYEEGI